MGVRALRLQLAVECFDEAVIRGLSLLGEVQGDRIGISPEIEVPRYELAAIINPDRLGIADPMADPFQRLDDILPAIAEPCIGHGTKAGMRIDDGQDSQLVAEGQLVMNKPPFQRMKAFAYRATHCPDIVLPRHRSGRWPRRDRRVALGAYCEAEALTHCKLSSPS